MAEIVITDEEKNAFCPEMTKDGALDYFYAHGNVPQYSYARARGRERAITDAAPDRMMWVLSTYAKGDQVVAECLISWTDAGVYNESPCIAILLFDRDGLVIRNRSGLNPHHWSGARV